jgi:hypothetical protein
MEKIVYDEQLPLMSISKQSVRHKAKNEKGLSNESVSQGSVVPAHSPLLTDIAWIPHSTITKLMGCWQLQPVSSCK